MEPTGDMWAGVGASLASSPGWMMVVALLVVGVLFIVAKYIVPSRERIKMRELDIREREAKNDAESIKVRAGMTEQMSGLRVSNDNLAQQSAALFAGIEESKVRSRALGEDMAHTRDAADHIKGTTDETNSLVKDIRRHIIGGEGTD